MLQIPLGGIWMYIYTKNLKIWRWFRVWEAGFREIGRENFDTGLYKAVKERKAEEKRLREKVEIPTISARPFDIYFFLPTGEDSFRMRKWQEYGGKKGNFTRTEGVFCRFFVYLYIFECAGERSNGQTHSRAVKGSKYSQQPCSAAHTQSRTGKWLSARAKICRCADICECLAHTYLCASIWLALVPAFFLWYTYPCLLSGCFE